MKFKVGGVYRKVYRGKQFASWVGAEFRIVRMEAGMAVCEALVIPKAHQSIYRVDAPWHFQVDWVKAECVCLDSLFYRPEKENPHA